MNLPLFDNAVLREVHRRIDERLHPELGYISLVDLAEACSLHPNTLRYYVSVGSITAVRRGRDLVFTATEAKAWANDYFTTHDPLEEPNHG